MDSSDPSKDKLVGRLKKLESVLDMKPAEMAELGGCSRATYYRYRKGVSTPSLDFLNRILKYEKSINAEWLLEGNGNVLKNLDGEDKKLSSPLDGKGSFHPFPLYKMHSDGKNGNDVDTIVNEIQSISFSKTFLKLLLHNDGSMDYKNAFAMVAEDSCMMPEVKEGGIIIIDNNQITPYSDGIFVVKYDEFIRMKIVQPLPGHKFLLTTLDKKYEPIIVEKDQDGFEILGRVVWSVNPV